MKSDEGAPENIQVRSCLGIASSMSTSTTRFLEGGVVALDTADWSNSSSGRSNALYGGIFWWHIMFLFSGYRFSCGAIDENPSKALRHGQVSVVCLPPAMTHPNICMLHVLHIYIFMYGLSSGDLVLYRLLWLICFY